MSWRLYVHILVFDAPTLRRLIDTFGATQLMLGTDHPFNFHERRPLERLREAGPGGITADALAFRNARQFLGARSADRLAENL